MSAREPGAAPGMPWTLVRLRWSLSTAALRTSPWQVVAYVFAYLMAFGVVAAAGIAGFAVGLSGNEAFLTGVLPTLMTLGGTVGIVLVALMQAMFIGESSTMSMDKFAPYGIADRTLQCGLLLAGLTGVPALAALASLMLWSMAYRGLGAAAVVTQLVAAPFIVLTAMCVSKAVLALSDLLVDSQAGKNAFYVVMIVLIVLCSQLPNLIMMNGLSLDAGAFAPAARVLGWLPLGSLFMTPFDAAAGRWLLCALRLAIALALCAACFLISLWCLRRRRTHVRHEGAARVVGLGAFAHMPDSPSGAVSARLVALLRRDARQSMTFVMPLFFVVIFALESGGIGTWLVWMGVLMGGLFMSLTESNGLAYDGQGFAMQVIAGTGALDDRRGRVRVYLIVDSVYMLLLALVAFLITGDWSSPQGVMTGLTFTAAGYGWALASLGVAEMCNCTLMYPVPSMDKPFTNPQGRGAAQAFLPFVVMLVDLACMLPTGVAAIVMAATGHADATVWLIPIALANGVAVLLLGTWLGAKLLRARMLAVLDTLTGFTALQQ